MGESTVGYAWEVVQFSSVQSFSHVRLFVAPWTAARQASLSITNSQSLLKLMSIDSVRPSNHLILCHPLLLPPSIFPSIFSNESVLRIRWPSIGVSASTSVLPINIQDWFPLGWAGWISLQSKGLSRVFSNTTVQNGTFVKTEKLGTSQASPVAQLVKNLPAMWETWVQSLGWEDPLEKGKTAHFSILV